MTRLIPKKIHYCWFGKQSLPVSACKCIESWKKFLPDYEIIQWNEDNFDTTQNQYIQEAYDAKKWAFVSDFARMKILFEHGGVYFDTDVELIKPLVGILERGPYMGCEQDGADADEIKPSSGIGIMVNPGLGMAAEQGNVIFKKILEGYIDARFLKEDGKFSTEAIIERTTLVLAAHGLMNKNEIQCIEGIYIYPKEYFCPITYRNNKLFITDNTYSIHHFAETWVSPYRRIRRKITCFLGENIMRYLRKAKHIAKMFS